jgi:hypothetical protein
MAATRLLLAPALVALGAAFHLAAGGAAAGLVVVAAWLARRRLGGLRAWRQGAMAALPWAIPAALADVAAAAWLAAALAGVGPLAFAAWYVAGGAMGAVTQLPLGLGLSDACCWAGITRLGGDPAAAMAVVVCTRGTEKGTGCFSGDSSTPCLPKMVACALLRRQVELLAAPADQYGKVAIGSARLWKSPGTARTTNCLSMAPSEGRSGQPGRSPWPSS